MPFGMRPGRQLTGKSFNYMYYTYMYVCTYVGKDTYLNWNLRLDFEALFSSLIVFITQKYVSILEPPFRISYHMFVVLKFPRLRVLEEMPVRLKIKKKEEEEKVRIGKKRREKESEVAFALYVHICQPARRLQENEKIKKKKKKKRKKDAPLTIHLLPAD